MKHFPLLVSKSVSNQYIKNTNIIDSIIGFGTKYVHYVKYKVI